jgi:tetratricopeptide (TPR) repeat protein
MNRNVILAQTRTAVRVILFSIIGTGVAAGTGFAGAHLYLESENPTPSTWPNSLRFSYRAAVFNSKYLDQQGTARQGLLAALQHENAEIDTTIGNDEDTRGVPAHNTNPTPDLAKAFILLGQIERKQGLLESAMDHFSKALTQGISNNNLRSLAARHLGELQENFGMKGEAQASFDLAIQSVLPSHQKGSTVKLDGTMKYSPELLDAAKAVALFKARQGDFKTALSSLLSVLQFQRQSPAVTGSSCLAASTMSNIAELVWALGDQAECRRWSTDSLAICTSAKNKRNQYCVECAGINHNMLGLLNKRDGDVQTARNHFRSAMMCAEIAKDENGLGEYASNLEQCV